MILTSSSGERVQPVSQVINHWNEHCRLIRGGGGCRSREDMTHNRAGRATVHISDDFPDISSCYYRVADILHYAYGHGSPWRVVLDNR